MIKAIEGTFQEQIAQKQPPLIALIMAWALSGILLTLITSLLLLIPSIQTAAKANNNFYLTTFAIIQISVIAFLIIYFHIHYLSAIHTKTTLRQPDKRLFFAALVLLPIFTWQCFNCVEIASAINKLSSGLQQGIISKSQFIEFIHSTFLQGWSKLPYGTTILGVIYSSILSIIAPILEEFIFTGFVLNTISKRFNVISGIIGTMGIFSIMHVFQFGFGMHLLFFAIYSLTYILIRLITGTVYFAILAHILINLIIFIPKWVFFYLDCRLQ